MTINIIINIIITISIIIITINIIIMVVEQELADTNEMLSDQTCTNQVKFQIQYSIFDLHQPGGNSIGNL